MAKRRVYKQSPLKQETIRPELAARIQDGLDRRVAKIIDAWHRRRGL